MGAAVRKFISRKSRNTDAWQTVYSEPGLEQCSTNLHLMENKLPNLLNADVA
jgi:hypothetical protein